jgi:hypothetical protein
MSEREMLDIAMKHAAVLTDALKRFLWNYKVQLDTPDTVTVRAKCEDAIIAALKEAQRREGTGA